MYRWKIYEVLMSERKAAIFSSKYGQYHRAIIKTFGKHRKNKRRYGKGQYTSENYKDGSKLSRKRQVNSQGKKMIVCNRAV